MRKIISVLLVMVFFALQVGVSAESPYASLIDAVSTDESVDMSLIDKDKIIYAEITSYINLDKGIKPTSFYLYMPSLNSGDYYTAGFDKNKYVATTKNFVATEPLKYYSEENAKKFALNNGLSNPSDIKVILTHGRIGLFAYSFLCDGKEYIIPYYFTDDSKYNITKDNAVRLSIGTAYTIDEFVNISKKEHLLYDEYMNAERKKDNRPTVSLDKNDDYRQNIRPKIILKEEELNEHYPLVDKMGFTFVAEDFFGDYVQENIADLGKTINAELEHYGNRNEDYFLLTMKGNLGKVCLWANSYRGLDSSNTLFSNNIPLTFMTCSLVENGDLVSYSTDIVAANRIYLKSVFANNSLNSVTMKYEPDSHTIKGWNNIEDVIEGNNIYYNIVNKTDNTMSGKFEEKNKETIINEQIKENEKYDVKEQNPERYATTVKGMRNDGKVLDYKITFVAEIPLNTFTPNASWFKGLGEDITATLVGFTQTLDGKEIRNYTMIRFTGSKNTIWFNNADTIPDNSDSEYIVVDNSYVSLTSFDGKERVYNSEKHNSLDMQITFNNDNDMKMVSISIIVDSESICVKSDKIKYIGGGKATYEKLF